MEIPTFLAHIGQLTSPDGRVLKERVRQLLLEMPQGSRATTFLGLSYVLWVNENRDLIWEIITTFKIHQLPPPEYGKQAKAVDSIIKAMNIAPNGAHLTVDVMTGIINLGTFGGRIDQQSDTMTEIRSRNVFPNSILPLESLDLETGEWSCCAYLRNFHETASAHLS
jgi:hypothetical protein